MQVPTCDYFTSGKCTGGEDCKEDHPRHSLVREPKQNAICKHFVTGLCKRGDKCRFAHTNVRVYESSQRFGLEPILVDLFPAHFVPAYAIGSSGENGWCPVCKKGINSVANTIVTTLPCQHQVHRTCCREWFRTRTCCPEVGCQCDITNSMAVMLDEERDIGPVRAFKDLVEALDTCFRGSISILESDGKHELEILPFFSSSFVTLALRYETTSGSLRVPTHLQHFLRKGFYAVLTIVLPKANFDGKLVDQAKVFHFLCSESSESLFSSQQNSVMQMHRLQATFHTLIQSSISSWGEDLFNATNTAAKKPYVERLFA